MMKTKRILSLVIAVVMLITLVGCGKSTPAQTDTKVTILKFAHVNGPDHPYEVAGTKFAQLVAERTNGKVKVETFHSGQLGNERELIEQCKLGSIDLVVTASAPWGNFMPEIMAFDLPFLFRDRAHAYKVLDGEIGKSFLTKLDKHNVVGLAYWENGFRHVSNSKREIKVPNDLQGLKIRLMENPVHLGTFKALGALPTPMALSLIRI